jgi:lysophospholipase
MGVGQEPLKGRFQQPDGWHWETMTNARGADLRYGMSLPAGKPRAHIVFVEGLSEYAEKTFELARDFNAQSAGFFVYDRQGQGLSGRFLGNPGKEHSQGFDHDADDLARFIRTKVPHDAPVIVLAHSAGGLVSTLMAHDNPGLADGIVMSAPMMGINNPLVKNIEALWSVLPLPRSLREHYIPNTDPEAWRRDDKRSDWRIDDYSSDPERKYIHDYWREQNPDLRTIAPTWGWVQEACRSITKTRRAGYLEAIETPIAIFTGGADKRVHTKHTFNAVARLPNAEHYHFPAAKHEMLMETDDIRRPLIDKALELAGRAWAKGFTPH